MILQLDVKNRRYIADWLSVNEITQHLSVDKEGVINAINTQEEYQGYYWVNVKKK